MKAGFTVRSAFKASGWEEIDRNFSKKDEQKRGNQARKSSPKWMNLSLTRLLFQFRGFCSNLKQIFIAFHSHFNPNPLKKFTA
jgi:hypothetical protein